MMEKDKKPTTLEQKIREVCLEYLNEYYWKERESGTEHLYNEQTVSCVSRLLVLMVGGFIPSRKTF